MTEAARALADKIDKLRKAGMGYDEDENPVTYEEFLVAHHDDFAAALRAPLAGTRTREVLEEGIEILFNLMDGIRKHGNYSPESTITFIDNSLQCFRRASLSLPDGEVKLHPDTRDLVEKLSLHAYPVPTHKR
jgi:hypothetical protein